MDNQKILENIGEPVAVGLAAAAATYFLFSSQSIELLGMSMNTALPVGLAVGGSSLIAETIREWVVPAKPGEQPSAAVKPLITGGAALVALGALVGYDALDIIAAVKIAALGGASEMIGSYTYHSYIKELLMPRA